MRAGATEALAFSEQRGDFLNIFKPRGATAAVFEPAGAEAAAGSAAVCVVNVHLNLGCDGQRDSQASEAVALGRRTAVAAATDGSGVGIAVVGDFNAHELDATVIRMAAAHGFVDAIAASGRAGAPRLTWTAANPLTLGTLREPDGCIDYVFFEPGLLRSRAARTVFCEAPFLSDHFGVLAELSLAPPAPPSPLLLAAAAAAKATAVDVIGCTAEAESPDAAAAETPMSVATAASDACSLPSSGCSTASGDFEEEEREEGGGAKRLAGDRLRRAAARSRGGTDATEESIF